MQPKRQCRVCGDELVDSNEYKSHERHNLGKICRRCHIEEMKSRYKNGKKHFFVTNDQYCILFHTKQEKIEYIAYRNSMKKVHKPPVEHMSADGKIVEDLIEENGLVYTRNMKCDECQSFVRYDKDGNQICENCGLMH